MLGSRSLTPWFRLGALSALCAWLGLVALPAQGAEELIDGIAAQVDDRIVLVSEVLRAVAPQEEAMRRAGAPPDAIAKLRADGLERLIESRLLEARIARIDLSASDEEIDQTIQGIAAENGLSLEQLYASVVFHGLSVEEYRRQIKHDFERRNLVNAVLGPRVNVEESEVRALYSQRYADQPQGGLSVRVRQILRAYGGPTQRTEAVACQETRDARARVVKGGEAFETVAAEVSEVAPRDGGDIGWLPLDAVASWMREALAPLETGEVSGVIVLPFGCAVLQLVEQRELEPVTFAQAEPALTRELYESKLETEYRSWLEELRELSYIERRGYFADAARFGERTFPIGPDEDDDDR
ncbi:MAG: SurA N-terminal domain-containing protein [Myxococcota bacterium]